MSGSQASAIAIMIRWRIPPENSKGYCFIRFSGSLIFTRRSISTARSQDAFRSRSVCSKIASMSWWPMVYVGFREVMGS